MDRNLLVSEDGDVVGMAFAQTGTGDAGETSAMAQVVECARTGVTHPGTKTTNNLADQFAHRARVAHTALNAFSDVLALRLAAAVAVGCAAAHRAR